MVKKMMLMGMLMTMLATTTYVFAEDVYSTSNGKKYHKEGCRLVKNKGAKKIDKADAVKKGLAPCHSCFKQEQALAAPQEQKKIN